MARAVRGMLTGYDHLLFLLGVIFFLTSVRDIVTLVTAFTLGHSITLTLATFVGITANYYLIDAVIALSVVYKGFDNSDGFRRYLDVNAPRLVTAVFVFGLVHGFGLSTRLQQLPLGEPGRAMLGRIVAFNVGVELGQIVALIGMLAVLTVWRRRASFPKFSVVPDADARLSAPRARPRAPGRAAAVAALLLGASASAVAHPPKPGEPPHSHGPRTWPPTHALTKGEIVDRAKRERDRLIREKKVDPTWETAAEPGAEEIVFDGQPEWRVAFRHPKPADRAKQTLYIFFTPTGRFVAANHTGK